MRLQRRELHKSAAAQMPWQVASRLIIFFLCAIIGFFLSASTSWASATDVYITPDGSGQGVCTNNPHPPSWFNDSTNWGSGSTQIGPGTTVHLCGNFIGSPGATLLTFHGNGSSGNPIVLHFESAAVLAAPYWSASGAIATNGNTWITIDGGTNGTIENTLNGTSGAACLGGACSYHQDSRFVYIGGCGTCNIEVKDLNLVNAYVHTPNSSDANGAGAEGVFFSGNHSNITVDNIFCHDAATCADGWGNNITLYNNEFYNCSSCIIFGTNAPTSTTVIHDNYIHDYSVWDTPSDSFHHDGIHFFPNSGTGNMSGLVVYNNLFANPGNCCNTAHLYFEGTFTNPEAFNNVCINQSAQAAPCMWFENNGGSPDTITNPLVVDNTVIGGNYTFGGNNDFVFASATAISFANNVVTGGQYLIVASGGSTFASNGISDNVYEDVAANGGQGFSLGSSTYGTLSAWQAALPAGTGRDSNSLYNTLSNLKIASDGHLLSGSPALQAGLNLSGLGIAALDSDKPAIVGVGGSDAGNSRPSSGSWPAGAYASGSIVAQPVPPSGLKVTVQ